MSPDNMTAFVLWDAHDDSLFAAEREIGYRSESACCIQALTLRGLLSAHLPQWPMIASKLSSLCQVVHKV